VRLPAELVSDRWTDALFWGFSRIIAPLNIAAGMVLMLSPETGWTAQLAFGALSTLGIFCLIYGLIYLASGGKVLIVRFAKR
jgi:hypothetical protein